MVQSPIIGQASVTERHTGCSLAQGYVWRFTTNDDSRAATAVIAPDAATLKTRFATGFDFFCFYTAGNADEARPAVNRDYYCTVETVDPPEYSDGWTSISARKNITNAVAQNRGHKICFRTPGKVRSQLDIARGRSLPSKYVSRNTHPSPNIPSRHSFTSKKVSGKYPFV